MIITFVLQCSNLAFYNGSYSSLSVGFVAFVVFVKSAFYCLFLINLNFCPSAHVDFVMNILYSMCYFDLYTTDGLHLNNSTVYVVADCKSQFLCNSPRIPHESIPKQEIHCNIQIIHSITDLFMNLAQFIVSSSLSSNFDWI